MKISLSPVSPFDFTLSAGIFSDGDKHIRRFEGGTFWQVVTISSGLVLIHVNSVGTIDSPRLVVELISDRKIDQYDKSEAERIVSSLLNLKLDLKPFYRIAKRDEVMSKMVKKLKGLKSPLALTPFEALIDSIIEQQISLKVAHGLQVKFIKAFGESLNVGGELYYAYPAPKSLGAASLQELRECGLSLRKSEYIREISSRIAQRKLDLDKYRNYDDLQAAIRELDGIRGIGVWTAEMTLVRGMGKLDALPADDLGLRRIMSHYYFGDRNISSGEARDVAKKWGQWKGLASFYLVMAAIKDVQL